ncbi:MAG: glycogen-binding domain-containing protein [Lentisphaeria bacterium]|nr:glycogen-binding domain-containing protein [Lentisphaeria bacterium]
MNSPKKSTGRRAVIFEFEDAPGKTVFLAGSFNNWQMTTRMNYKAEKKVYSCRLLLEPGDYQYKFVVDGEWRLDGANSCFTPNGFGELNSVIRVEERK